MNEEQKLSTSVDSDAEERVCAQCGAGQSVLKGLEAGSFNCAACGNPFHDHPDSASMLEAAAVAAADPGPTPTDAVDVAVELIAQAEVDDPELAGLKVVVEQLAAHVSRLSESIAAVGVNVHELGESVSAQRGALADFEAKQDEIDKTLAGVLARNPNLSLTAEEIADRDALVPGAVGTGEAVGIGGAQEETETPERPDNSTGRLGPEQ